MMPKFPDCPFFDRLSYGNWRLLDSRATYTYNSSVEIRWVYPRGVRLGDVRTDDFGRRLVIRNVTESHEGQYRCEASNGAGPSLSHAFDVHVQGECLESLLNHPCHPSLYKPCSETKTIDTEEKKNR
jgi:hypothetical protein